MLYNERFRSELTRDLSIYLIIFIDENDDVKDKYFWCKISVFVIKKKQTYLRT